MTTGRAETATRAGYILKNFGGSIAIFAERPPMIRSVARESQPQLTAFRRA